jgi:CheY-like chemotaxis protein
MRNSILLIDDDNIQHFIAKATLKKLGQELNLLSYLEASDALTYLATLSSEDLPTFILLDLNMPNMDGWEFLDHYKNLPHRTDIIIVTSSIDVNDINKSKEYTDVKQFVSKPLDAEKLNTILNFYKQEI